MGSITQHNTTSRTTMKLLVLSALLARQRLPRWSMLILLPMHNTLDTDTLDIHTPLDMDTLDILTATLLQVLPQYPRFLLPLLQFPGTWEASFTLRTSWVTFTMDTQT